jgi:hypothetical protein
MSAWYFAFHPVPPFVHGLGRVLCESVLCDLALLTVDDDSFWEALPAVQLQESRSIPAFGVLAHLCC